MSCDLEYLNQFDIYELTGLTSRKQQCATYFVSVTGLRTALNTTLTIQHVNQRENLLYFGAKRKQQPTVADSDAAIHPSDLLSG